MNKIRKLELKDLKNVSGGRREKIQLPENLSEQCGVPVDIEEAENKANEDVVAQREGVGLNLRDRTLDGRVLLKDGVLLLLGEVGARVDAGGEVLDGGVCRGCERRVLRGRSRRLRKMHQGVRSGHSRLRKGRRRQGRRSAGAVLYRPNPPQE